MSFVKTPQEVKEIEALLAGGRFTTESVSVEFQTTFEFLRAVLPPCFELPDEPTAIANVSRWQSAMCGEFDCGMILLNCKYKGQAGTTMLALYVSNDMPVSIGREMWGEGKKTANCQLYFDGDDAYGYAERNGVRLIEISAEFGPDMGPMSTSNLDFEIKAQPHVTGIGLQNDVVLNCMKTEENYRVTRSGTATLKLAGSVMDPLDTIPVVSVGAAFYAEGESSWTVPWFDELPDRDAYVPFIYGQKYDDFRFFPKAKRFQ
ncbi:acetoacetate decarboxylase family protein [Pseudomonas sp. O230]|uniref:acetoacetate decarboxylase family protein n=1 Tax=Pseudomonas sp. O230 TaxID=3159450 RepID=UPI00387B02EE